jgi:hypothetical protein
MIVELNIEAQDLDAAVRFLQDNVVGPNGYVRTRVDVARYEGPNGLETQAVLVARVTVPSAEYAIGLAYNVAVAFDQDCVALVMPIKDGKDYGMLVGPNAAKWGEFSLEYFKPFDRKGAV